MGFRLRKIIRILPGLRLNLSKSGVSASIGERGATVNLSDQGARSTVGIPGSGLSYSERISAPGKGRSVAGWVILAAVVGIWALGRLL
jgi:hypothetical protein